jgi:hypothetical protein
MNGDAKKPFINFRKKIMSTSLKNRNNIIPATKAVAVRKKIKKLSDDVVIAYSSASVSKKELNEIKKSVKKDLDSLGEMGEMESLRLQMAMDRMSKMMTALSNILKKLNDTADSIVENLK